MGLSKGYDRSDPTYLSWVAMRSRCRNPKDSSYARYGGRGISVCERWSSYALFLADMGFRPEETSIDRIDVNGNYEPGNCRWATQRQQHNNRRDNHVIQWDGRSQTLTQWARELGIGWATLLSRLDRWGLPRAFTEPLNVAKRTQLRPLITHNGKTQSVSDWARELGLKYTTLKARLDKGFAVDAALRAGSLRNRNGE
jgi:hypothetical protein